MSKCWSINCIGISIAASIYWFDLYNYMTITSPVSHNWPCCLELLGAEVKTSAGPQISHPILRGPKNRGRNFKQIQASIQLKLGMLIHPIKCNINSSIQGMNHCSTTLFSLAVYYKMQEISRHIKTNKIYVLI